MRKRYLFLMSLLFPLAAMMSSGRAYAQTDAEYNFALAAIGDFADYYVTTNYAGVKYYLTAGGTLTAEKDDAVLFNFSLTGGGEFKPSGYYLDGGAGNYFSNPASSGNINDTKLNTHTISGCRTTWEAQVFFMNLDGKFAVRATNAASTTATSGWNWVGQSFWAVKTNASGPYAGYSFDVTYIWELEDEEGNAIEPPTDMAKIYTILNSVIGKYGDHVYSDGSGDTMLPYGVGDDFGQYSDVESWGQFFELLQEILYYCDSIDPSNDYEWIGDGECPTADEAEALAAKADELYNKILESIVQYTMPQDGYYRIITNLLYATKDKDPDTEETIFVNKAIAASFSADHKDKAVYATLDRDKAHFLWKLTKSETGDSILIQNAGMGTYISLSKSPNENRLVMTEDAADASYVMFDYGGLDYVEFADREGDDKDVFHIRLASQERDGGNYVHQLGHGLKENAGTILGHAGEDQGTEMELSFWYSTFTRTNGDRGTSEWYLEYVPDSEAEELIANFEIVKNHDLLVAQNNALRAEVLAALTTAKDDIRTKLITSASQMSSPYSHNDIGGGTDGGNLSAGVLIDGDKSTYWHSAWNNTPQEYHYIQIADMQDMVGDCELYFCERADASNDRPTEFLIVGSEDPEAEEDAWEEIVTLQIPNYAAGAESTIPFYVETPYPYIRVICTNTDGSAGFRWFWHAAELQFCTVRENPNSQYAALGDVAKTLDETYEENAATPDAQITLEMYQALLDAYKAFLAAMVDPTELRTAMETYASVTKGVVVGEGPGLWPNAEIAEAYDALRAEIAAYDKAGIYNAAQNHKYAVMLKAMQKSIAEQANGVKTDKWYHIMFPTEEMFTNYGFEPSKVGGDSRIEDNPNQWGYYVAPGMRENITGVDENGEETVTGYSILPYTKEEVREGKSNWLFFINDDDIEDKDVSMFRFIEHEATDPGYTGLFKEMKENMLMALDMSTTYTKGEALITDASQLSTNSPDPSEGLHIEYAVDGNPSTFWHSDYHKKYLEPAYLQVALNEPVSGLIQVDVTRRQGIAYGHIVRMYIQGSNDAENWTNIGYLETPYTNLNESVTSQPVDLGGSYKHLRFTLTQRATSGGVSPEFDPFAVITSEDQYDVEGGWTYFHVAEFQIYPVTADKELTASGKTLRNAYTTLNKVILKDATARDVASAAQAYRAYRAEFNAAEGMAVLPYGKDQASSTYAIQNKATGLFIHCNPRTRAENSLELIPTFFDISALGFERMLLHGLSVDGSNCTYLHSQNFDHRFVTWNDTQVDYNSALAIVEADEEYAAPRGFDFYKDIKPGKIYNWCNSVTVIPDALPEDAHMYTSLGRFTNEEGDFLALKSIQSIPAGQPAFFIYGDTLEYDAEDDYVEPVKFTMPGNPEMVVKGDTINGAIGILDVHSLKKHQIYFSGNHVVCVGAEGYVVYPPSWGVVLDLDIELCPNFDPDEEDYDFAICLEQEGDKADGVENVPATIEKLGQPGNVYSIDGKLLRSGATLNSLKAMGKGIYILNGVKVVVK